VRSLFAYVEGLTYAFKRYALALHEQREPIFSNAEIALLREVSYDLSDKGEALEQGKFLRFASNLRFAIRAFARISAYEAGPDFLGQGWQALRKGIQVRNRITHPKRPDDLTVSDIDLVAVSTGVRWFQEETGKILDFRQGKAP